MAAPVVLAAMKHVSVWGLILIGLGAFGGLVWAAVGMVWLGELVARRRARTLQDRIIQDGFEFYARRIEGVTRSDAAAPFWIRA